MSHDMADQSMKRKSENRVGDGTIMVVERARKVFSALLPPSRLPRTSEEVVETLSELLQFDVHTLIDLEDKTAINNRLISLIDQIDQCSKPIRNKDKACAKSVLYPVEILSHRRHLDHPPKGNVDVGKGHLRKPSPSIPSPHCNVSNLVCAREQYPHGMQWKMTMDQELEDADEDRIADRRREHVQMRQMRVAIRNARVSERQLDFRMQKEAETRRIQLAALQRKQQSRAREQRAMVVRCESSTKIETRRLIDPDRRPVKTVLDRIAALS